MEHIDAKTLLGVSAKASEMEIEAAYRDRTSAVRKQFDDARDHRTREKCKREHHAIEEARSKLLRDLKDQEQRQREESQRLATEERQREESQRLAAEQRQREESHRLAAEQRQREESHRLAAEQRQREESQRLAAEQRQREESHRSAAEQRQREENQRLAAEQHQREESHRLAAEQRQRQENQRLAAEQRQHEESHRLVAEQRQHEESHRLAAEQRQREENQRLAAEQRQREENQRLAAEQRQREENQRLAAEQRQREENQRLAAEQRQREENQRLAAEQRQREEKKHLAARLVGGLALILACVLAAVLFWPHAPNEPKLAKLVLNTLPANADVFVDGVSRGKTPLALDDVVPGERQLLIQLEGYQDEELIVLIKPGDERFFPPVTLIPKPVSNVTPTPGSPTATATPNSPTVTPTPGSPTATATPSSPAVTPTPGPPTVTPALSGYPGEEFPQTRQRLLTEAEVANLDYAELRYAINEMYARHGAQFLKEPDLRKQFEKFSWYYPIPEMTLSRIDREFTRVEKQNLDLLARLRDQKRHR